MSKNNSSSMPSPAPAIAFVAGGDKRKSQPKPAASKAEQNVVAFEPPAEEKPAAPPGVKTPPKKPAQPKATVRQDLAREMINHRVRIDIHERLADERHFQFKQKNRMTLADIADEALHLGLQQLEKRRTKSA